ncbi:sensor histidine kinase [Nonlabens ponticola]|uniref:histidine kinase n=1 Tax=Nonlabens ponticola TaxID=2496866 RepID=A0A3S9MWA0_9FLAO|nr:HAMP domain-containing sensor histidine kinase [Nonlabens ponticola]AZQ43460.1 HAMP domain-containing histidine kinase [Nonlabens ponticola]
MNAIKYSRLLLLAAIVTLLTIAVQVYLLYKDFEVSEQDLNQDVRQILDDSVEDYFTLQATTNKIDLTQFTDSSSKKVTKFQEILTIIDLPKNQFKERIKELVDPDSIQVINSTINETPNKFYSDGTEKMLFGDIKKKNEKSANSTGGTTSFKFSSDNLEGEILEFSSRVVFSYKYNEIDLEVLDSLVQTDLQNEKIDIHYDFAYTFNDSLITLDRNIAGDTITNNNILIKVDSELKMVYGGQTSTILKRNLAGLSVSLILILVVMGCLFYLLQIIKRQKQITQVKNDLISNITHEFKTPIATASAALEGVQNFTGTTDSAKSDKYLEIGREQLVKLNVMVEKLLETATIDSEQLLLRKTRFDMTTTVSSAVNRNKTEKKVNVDLPKEEILIHGDEFYLDNAINNLIDNAIKYGGNVITVSLKKNRNLVELIISDNGKKLNRENSKLIFEKFYRVSKGNQHDVKGHGIGLFYSRAIIEKHGGTLTLSLDPTTFKASLPYE